MSLKLTHILHCYIDNEKKFVIEVPKGNVPKSPLYNGIVFDKRG